MTAERFFFPAVLAACAVLALLSAAEPARVAEARVAAAPVVQLDRVVVTAHRLEAPRAVASAATATDDAAVVR